MQIAVDARPLAFAGNGNARYLEGMLTELFKHFGDAVHWQLLSHRGIDSAYTGLVAKTNVELIIEASILPRVGPVWLHTGMPKMLKRLQPGLFWGTLGLLPRNFKKKLSMPAILNVHDLNAFSAPETMVKWNRMQHRMFAQSSIEAADTVMCLSDATRQDIIKNFPDVKSDKLKVVYPGIHPNQAEPVRPATLPFYSEEFFLSVGTVEPRKNFRTLIEAYMNAKRENPYLHPLVIAGRKGWGLGPVTTQLVNGELKNHGIHFIEGPNERELTWLYEKCHAAFFPSLHEGFGLPVLEAQQNEKLTIVSDIPIFREVCPTARFIEPMNVDGWKQEFHNLHGKKTPKESGFDSKFWKWSNRAKDIAQIIESYKV